jgi:hypothetical protein
MVVVALLALIGAAVVVAYVLSVLLERWNRLEDDE